MAACHDRAGGFDAIRLHGDSHPGSILWCNGPFLVGLDDCRSGPAARNLWRLLSGEPGELAAQVTDLREGYTQFQPFDLQELQLIEALRTQRLLPYAAWFARRWEDPAFPAAFPWFGEARYWEELVLNLREQLARMRKPPTRPPA